MNNQVITVPATTRRSGLLEDGHNVIGVLLLFPVIMLTCILLIFGFKVSILPALKWGAYLGSIFYCLVIIPLCWTFVKANTAVIVQNILRPLPKPITDTDMTNVIKVPNGQRALLAGPRFVWPWEKQAGSAISMTATSNLKITIDTNDYYGLGFSIAAVIPVLPAPGSWLPNFNRVTPEVAKEHFEGICKAWIESNFRQYDGQEIMSDIEGFRQLFQNEALGGPNRIDEVEMWTGRFTWKPRIDSIKPTLATQEMLESGRQAQTTREAARIYMKAGLDAHTAMLLVAAQQNIPVTLFGGAIQGLEQLQHVSVGAGVIPAALVQKKGKKPGRKQLPPPSPI